jgi:hypothetical protein
MDIEHLEAFCKDWLAAWTGNKPEKLIGFYTVDVYYQDPANPKGISERKHLLSYLKKLLARNPNWKWELMELFPTEKGFNFKWKATIPVASGQVVEYGMDIVELDFDIRKITRNEVYFDPTQLLS